MPGLWHVRHHAHGCVDQFTSTKSYDRKTVTIQAPSFHGLSQPSLWRVEELEHQDRRDLKTSSKLVGAVQSFRPMVNGTAPCRLERGHGPWRASGVFQLGPPNLYVYL